MKMFLYIFKVPGEFLQNVIYPMHLIEIFLYYYYYYI